METKNKVNIKVAHEPENTPGHTADCRQVITIKDGDKVTVVRQYGKNNICVGHVDTLNL